MVIEKNDKKYDVRECKTTWSVSWEKDGLNVNYKIDKNICPTEEELKEFIEKEKMF